MWKMGLYIRKGAKSMYVHIGKGLVINGNDIIAIFSIDYIKNTKDYKKFYQKLLEYGNIVDISNGNAKSLILVNKNDGAKAYISNINSNTIGKRKF